MQNQRIFANVTFVASVVMLQMRLNVVDLWHFIYHMSSNRVHMYFATWIQQSTDILSWNFNKVTISSPSKPRFLMSGTNFWQ